MNISLRGPEHPILKTILVLLILFLVTSFSLFLGYILKNLNPSEYGLIHGKKEDLEITYKEILFYGSVILDFFVLSFAYRYAKNGLRSILIVLALIYLFSAGIMILADIVYYLIFASRMNFSAIQTILNTNPSEVSDFTKMYFSPGVFSAIVLFIVVIRFIVWKWPWFKTLFSSFFFFVVSFLLSTIAVIDFIQIAHSKGNGLHNMRYWDITIGEYNEYREFNRRLGLEKNKHSLSKEYDAFFKKDSLPKTLVFVVSESLSKGHMSLYGYPRKTTPHLDANRSLNVFNNCVTQSALTIEAVPGLFFQGYLSKQMNLIVLLKKLGYQTSWISNQSGWGKGDRTIVLLSQLSNNSYFTDARVDNDGANYSLHYDEEVLDQFDKTLKENQGASKFIVLHLMGCHFDYEKRYPASKEVFKSAAPIKTHANTERAQRILNSYDNAMHYHDSIINEIILKFSDYGKDKNAALVFLSDHGEELYENRDHAGHSYPPTKETAEIPYFTVLSPTFRKNYPNLEQMMIQRKNTAYSTENNFYTLIQLLNIDSKKYKNKILRKSFFSPYYDSISTRFVMGLEYDKISL